MKGTRQGTHSHGDVLARGAAAERKPDCPERGVGAPAEDVPARRAAEVLLQLGEHRIDDIRVDGRRGVVVEIDSSRSAR
jgi:hypothetical protein